MNGKDALIKKLSEAEAARLRDTQNTRAHVKVFTAEGKRLFVFFIEKKPKGNAVNLLTMAELGFFPAKEPAKIDGCTACTRFKRGQGIDGPIQETFDVWIRPTDEQPERLPITPAVFYSWKRGKGTDYEKELDPGTLGEMAAIHQNGDAETKKAVETYLAGTQSDELVQQFKDGEYKTKQNQTDMQETLNKIRIFQPRMNDGKMPAGLFSFQAFSLDDSARQYMHRRRIKETEYTVKEYGFDEIENPELVDGPENLDLSEAYDGREHNLEVKIKAYRNMYEGTTYGFLVTDSRTGDTMASDSGFDIIGRELFRSLDEYWDDAAKRMKEGEKCS